MDGNPRRKEEKRIIKNHIDKNTRTKKGHKEGRKKEIRIKKRIYYESFEDLLDIALVCHSSVVGRIDLLWDVL